MPEAPSATCLLYTNDEVTSKSATKVGWCAESYVARKQYYALKYTSENCPYPDTVVASKTDCDAAARYVRRVDLSVSSTLAGLHCCSGVVL